MSATLVTPDSGGATAARAVIVLTTLGAEADAHVLARALVTERLAACVNILPPMTSLHRWEGKRGGGTGAADRHQDHRRSAGTARGRMRALHPYEVPELVVVAVADGGADYRHWVADSVGE